jgi:AP-1 complex subunit mu
MKDSPNDNALVWTIKQFSLRAHFGLPSVESEEEESKRPIVVLFEIPFFTASGLRVQYLKVFEKSGYQAVTWVQHLTTGGNYGFRTSG